MTANAIPCAIDEPLVQLDLKPVSTKLSDVLNRLSNNVSRNGKVLVEVIEELQGLKLTVEGQGSRQKKFEAQVTATHLSMSEEMEKMQKELADISSRCAWRDRVEKMYVELLTMAKRSSDFIDEIENGSGARVHAFVEAYVKEYVPQWYQTVEEPMWKKIDSKMSDFKTEVARRLESRVGQAEEKGRTQAANMKSQLFDHVHAVIEDRKRDLQTFKDQTEVTTDGLHARITETNTAWEGALRQSEADIARQLAQLNEISQALHRTLCIDEELCAELVEECGGMKDAKVYLTLEEAQNDPRVSKIQRTPHFLHLRTAMQHEINDRVGLMKEEVHQDLATEVFDIQRELKSKVTTSKMPDLLEAHRDQALYQTVKNTVSEVIELRRNKLDSVSFLEALRSKADLKAVDSKVDRITLTEQMTSFHSRVDEVDLHIAKVFERLKTAEENQVDLAIFMKTGRPPDRDFPTTKSVAELLAENVKEQVDAILVGSGDDGANGEVIVAGDDKRDGLAQLGPARPKAGGRNVRPATSGQRAVESSGPAPASGSAAATGRVGSARPGAPMRGLPSATARAQSARTSQQPSQADLQDAVIPLTMGQRSYCEALALEQPETQRLCSAGSGRGRGGTRGSSKSQRQSSGNVRRLVHRSIDDPDMEEEELAVLLPELRDRDDAPSPPFFPSPAPAVGGTCTTSGGADPVAVDGPPTENDSGVAPDPM